MPATKNYEFQFSHASFSGQQKSVAGGVFWLLSPGSSMQDGKMRRLRSRLPGANANPKRQRGAVAWIAAFGMFAGLGSSSSKAAEWLAGPALRAQLAQPVKLAWSGVPIRKGLADLARSQSVAMLLDRRVDPGLPLDLSLDNVPVELALERIARSQHLGVSWYGPLVYLGPEPAAARLRTLAALRAAEAKSLPAAKRSSFTKTQAWHWDDFAEPRTLVEQLAEEARVDVSGIDKIPHDLWPAADLPPLSWTDRLTLVANEFDLTFRIDDDGRKIELIPVPESVVLERSYPGGRNPQELAERWRREAADAEIKVEGDKVVVRGRAEDHEALTAAKPRPQTPAAGGTEVYTLAVRDQPLGPVLEELKQRLGLELHIDEAALKKAEISLDRRVSFNVDKATLDELLAAALKPAGLTFRRRDKAIDIFPARARGSD
jgi:hypothetical protein